MNQIYIWIKIGIEHITDLNGYDHILFLIALCCIYNFNDFKKLLINVTAFTIGHSLSLVLSVFKIIEFSSTFIEFLIPVTILINCILNIVNTYKNKTFNSFKYTITMVFGLIHGMGFSNMLKQMLGKEESILFPLLSFNIGIEIGQLIIVFVSILFTYLIINLFKVKRTIYINGVSILIAVLALYMSINRL
jgi:hypothetical protein